jgi:beta-ketodecanoyl-[acyl-carrier-protein] synthase
MTGSSRTTGIAITGTGVWTPENVITNDELVAAFNEFVRRENARNAEAIAAGTMEPLKDSSVEFILKASGIKQRYAIDKAGILDPERMFPNIPDRPEEQLSVQAEMAVNAAQRALAAAGRTGADLDLIILTSSNLQRPYPAIGIEVQHALGAGGYAYDVVVGCSSMTFSIQAAVDALRSGSATCAMVVAPEICTGHLNWRDRDCHFIFGDAACAVVLEPVAGAKPGAYEVLSTRATSKFSSNIRNNSGFLDRASPETRDNPDKLFHQQGRKVFKDVVPLAAQFIGDHVASHGLDSSTIGRYWLHQANQSMNELIAKRLLGRDATRQDAPLILDEYGNTASVGSLIAFAKYSDDLPAGTHGVISSFGAGYSIGSILVRRI